MRMLAGLLATALLAAGCGGSSEKKPAPKPPSSVSPGEAVIRGWTTALYNGQYEKAANYFAPRAIVQQGRSFVLRSHEEAVFFGRTLPCRAKVTAVKAEKKGTLLASFDFFPGLHGTCPDGGSGQVRFFIRKGKIETWRQLRSAPTAPGRSV
jgi:hypothetical protein